MNKSTRPVIAICAMFLTTVSLAHAYPLGGTTPLAPGQTVIPGIVPSGSSPGTGPLVTTTAFFGASTFTATVFRDASGTLDFYFQLANNQSAGAFFSRLSASGFAPYVTSVGYRLDGSTVPVFGPSFADGSVAPLLTDRDASGNTLGFNFGAALLSGTVSRVFIISTNATAFGSVAYQLTGMDGAATTTFFFNGLGPTGPAAPITTVPDSGTSVLLLGLGLAALLMARRAGRGGTNSSTPGVNAKPARS